MSETDMDMECEIECLDEDADIVQHYVQKVDDSEADLQTIIKETIETPIVSELLQERPERKRKRKSKKEEEDSDYDPSEEIRQRFKKRNRPSRPIYKKESGVIERTSKYDIKIRRTLDIRIPDYEDPLCLPFRALNRDVNDMKKLRNWNNLSLKHFRMHEVPLRPDLEDSVSSSRTVVLRNLQNKQTDKVETTMWSKITAVNRNGVKKSEIIQSMLPRYKEKKFLKPVLLGPKQTKPVSYREEVILTKEFNKNEEMLVVYNPKHALSCTYKMFEKKSELNDEESRKYLQEQVVCKMCVPCYQMSWRGLRKANTSSIKCSVCGRGCVSVYNLLSHVRSHTNKDVHALKSDISKTLAEVLEYHYECRICQQKCPSIKTLRAHINTHKGTKPFICEIGDHVAT